MKTSDKMIDPSTLNNTSFLNRMNALQDKNNLANISKLNFETDYGKELIKKSKENSSNIKKTIESTKIVINNKLRKEKNKLDDMRMLIADVNQRNEDMKNKIIINEQKVAAYISSKLTHGEKKLNDVCNEILLCRKRNFITFDNRINFYYKSNKSIRTYKKKLYLLMNFLKLKIIDTSLSNESNREMGLDETKVANLGYFLKIEKNRLKPVYISVSLDEVSRIINFWKNFYEYFKSDF